MSTNVSRRAIAQGSLWAVPAVAAASAAPAFALSACQATSCLRWGGTPGSATYATTLGTSSGSRVQLNFGIYDIAPGCGITGAGGYRVDYTSVVATDQAGATYAGNIVTQSNTPGLINAPLAQFVGVQFPTFAYNGPAAIDPDWDAGHYLASYKVCYTITYLTGLTGSQVAAPCAYCATITASPNSTHIGGTLSTTLGS